MVTTVSANTIRQNVDQFLESIQKSDQTVIVEDHGKQIAVIISLERYQQLLDPDAASDWAVIHEMQMRNAHFDPDDVLREVTEVVEHVRQELYEEDLRASQSSH
jgi:PHD/YefM family antitoxin component YafN of YafNO toxin-antitoxin module